MSVERGLRLHRVAILGLAAAFIACPGCETAHYVTRSPDSGIVAIPENTPALRQG